MKIEVLNLCCQIHELAMTRQLTSQITTKGAGLYDLLGKEVEMRVSGTSVNQYSSFFSEVYEQWHQGRICAVSFNFLTTVIQYYSFLAKYTNSGTKAEDMQFHSLSYLHNEVCLLFMLLNSLYKYFAVLLE
jgi:hypothetical protein